MAKNKNENRTKSSRVQREHDLWREKDPLDRRWSIRVSRPLLRLLHNFHLRLSLSTSTREARDGMSLPAKSAPPSTARPIARLAYASTVTCAAPASAYGKCIAASYMDVTKGMCEAEFKVFRECVKTAVCLLSSVIEQRLTG